MPLHLSTGDLAREDTEEAIGTLVRIMKDESAPPSGRLHAAQAILDRGWGKPAHAVEIDTTGPRTLVELLAEDADELEAA